VPIRSWFTVLLNRAYTSAQNIRVESYWRDTTHTILDEGGLPAYFDPDVDNYDKPDRHEQEKRGESSVGKTPCLSYSSRSFTLSFFAKLLQVNRTCYFKSRRRVFGTPAYSERTRDMG